MVLKRKKLTENIIGGALSEFKVTKCDLKMEGI